MRTVSYKHILDGVARLYNGASALTVEDAAVVSAGLDSLRLDELWSFANWLELDVIEERLFTVGQHLPYATAGKTAMGTVHGVTRENPLLCPGGAALRYRLREDTLQVLERTNQTSVWVRFMRRVPRVTSTVWVETETYGTGAVVYNSSTGQCYVSLADGNTGHAVTETAWWALEALPEFATGYLIRAGLAELYASKDKAGQADKYEAQALERLDEAYWRQGGLQEQTQRADVQLGAEAMPCGAADGGVDESVPAGAIRYDTAYVRYDTGYLVYV